jgi:CubicO group peptidase (beta-lactamase class C family)
MFTRRAFMGSALAAGALPSALAAAPNSRVAANVAAYLQPFVERRDFSGFVLLERGGSTLLSRGFGYADFEARRPNTADTGYMTASIGKLFTRAAVLELERQGRLAKADPLARFLPSFPNAQAITVQHLIDHQAGIARDLPPGTDLAQERSLDDLLAIIAAQPAIGKPGSDGGYSNNGYRLLAKVIEAAGRGSYDELVRELVFEPRGMRATRSGVDLNRVGRRAVGYRPGAGWGRSNASRFDRSAMSGAPAPST